MKEVRLSLRTLSFGKGEVGSCHIPSHRPSSLLHTLNDTICSALKKFGLWDVKSSKARKAVLLLTEEIHFALSTAVLPFHTSLG